MAYSLVPVFQGRVFELYFITAVLMAITMMIGLRVGSQTVAAAISKWFAAFWAGVKKAFGEVKTGIENSPDIRKDASLDTADSAVADKDKPADEKKKALSKKRDQKTAEPPPADSDGQENKNSPVSMDASGGESGNVVAEIVRKYKDDVLLEPQRLSGLIADLIPGKPTMRKRLKLAIDEKVPQKLRGLKDKDAHEQDRVMRIEASGLSDLYGMPGEMAYEIVNYFAVALGYKTIAAAPRNEQPKAPAPPQSAIKPNALVDNVVDIEMVFVQGGTFRMGNADGQGNYDEKPMHDITLRDFYIGKYPVTQKQWIQVMGSNPSKFKDDNLPVETVSWNNAQSFIVELNTMTGKNYRLLTEAEWEYAARGGNSSKGYEYSGSNNIDDVAWYKDNSDYKTHPIGTKAPNELGICDMTGNVWEWVNDWYDSEYYKNSPQTRVCLKKCVNDNQGVKSHSYLSIFTKVWRAPRPCGACPI